MVNTICRYAFTRSSSAFSAALSLSQMLDTFDSRISGRLSILFASLSPYWFLATTKNFDQKVLNLSLPSQYSLKNPWSFIIFQPHHCLHTLANSPKCTVDDPGFTLANGLTCCSEPKFRHHNVTKFPVHLMTHHTMISPSQTNIFNFKEKAKQGSISSPRTEQNYNIYSFLRPCLHCFISDHHDKTASHHQPWRPARRERKSVNYVATHTWHVTHWDYHAYEDTSMHHPTTLLSLVLASSPHLSISFFFFHFIELQIAYLCMHSRLYMLVVVIAI